ncbi:MAG: hypothetical protein R3C49_21990 [Planctomycetaceae bacterium]
MSRHWDAGGRLWSEFVGRSEEGLEETLEPSPSTRIYERKLDGRIEAHLVHLPVVRRLKDAAADRLLSDRLVGRSDMSIPCHETVRQTLKKRP